ncbi:MAG: hypothetical protein IID59_11465, partial [Proteobacteria bacterium]|nr:hypothetical protein [Pseudomonadota bacterium]
MNDEQRDSAGPKMQVVHYDDDGLPGAVTRIAPGERFTELGNAKRFAYQHGSRVRFVWPWNRWLFWDGKRWRNDDSGTIPTLAKRTVDSLCAEAAEFSDDQRREALRHAARSESAAAMRGMLELARSEPGIPVSPDDLDSNPMLLNALNGTVNLRTGMLRDHDPDDLISHLAEAELSDQKCPLWLGFLDKIFAGQQDLIDYLQRAVGYTLTGGTDEQCLFFLHGNGANGKSTFIGAVEHVLGSYALTTPAETLMATRRDSIPNDVARLNGIRMVVASELDEGKRFNESRIKDLT